jgi:hypothetical protein
MDLKPRSLSEIRAEIEAAEKGFLTPEMFEPLISFPSIDKYVELEGELEDLKTRPKTSYKKDHDPAKIQYLLRMGVKVPDTWYSEKEIPRDVMMQEENFKPSEMFEAKEAYHAEIVTAAIIVEHLKDIFYVMRINGSVSSETLAKELEYHSAVILEKRVDQLGHREPDATGHYRNREERIKSQKLSANPKGQVSLRELMEIRDIVLDSYK